MSDADGRFAGAAPLSIKPKAWTCSDSRANL